MIKQKILKLFSKSYSTKVERLDPSKGNSSYSSSVKRIMNLLTYTRKNDVSYSGYNFYTGYHTLEIGGHVFQGQRKPKERFKDLPFSLEGLSALDVGCNQGGMLHAFGHQLKSGVGVDYDHKMINVANKIKSFNEHQHLNFYVFNLEDEDLGYMEDFLPEGRVDVAFMLSICIWVSNWKDVIIKVKSLSDKLVFESNGKEYQQTEQIEFLKTLYESVDLIHDKSEDDPTQKQRKLLVCY